MLAAVQLGLSKTADRGQRLFEHGDHQCSALFGVEQRVAGGVEMQHRLSRVGRPELGCGLRRALPDTWEHGDAGREHAVGLSAASPQPRHLTEQMAEKLASLGWGDQPQPLASQMSACPSRHAAPCPGPPLDAQARQPLLLSLRHQTVQEAVGCGIVALPCCAQQGGCRGETDKKIERARLGQAMQMPAAQRFRMQDARQLAGVLRRNRTVVEHPGCVYDPPQRPVCWEALDQLPDCGFAPSLTSWPAISSPSAPSPPVIK